MKQLTELLSYHLLQYYISASVLYILVNSTDLFLPSACSIDPSSMYVASYFLISNDIRSTIKIVLVQ